MRNWMVAVIVLAGIVAYHNSLTGPFIFDDHHAIVENSHVRRLWPLTEALTSPAQASVDGRPVVALSLAVNYAVGGLNVTGYHLFNLAFHIGSALLLFGIVRRTRTAGPWIALAVATIWLVHPLTTEAVNYIIQRTELLMAFFLLLTLYSFIRGWYFASVVACAVGMGCKEVMAVTPVLVWLYDRTFLGGTLRKRAGYYAGLAATWLVLAAWMLNTPRAESLGDLAALDYALTQCGVIMHYLRLAVWPAPLVVDYYDWPVGWNLPATVAIGALLAGTFWALCRRSWLGFAGAWFFLILAPSSSVVPIATELAAERRMYLPLVAVVTVVVVALSRCLQLCGGLQTPHCVRPKVSQPADEETARSGDPRRTTWWQMWLVIALPVALTVGTIQRNEDYRSEVRVLTDTIAKRPGNARAHVNLATALVKAGRVEEGMAHCREALRIKPGYDYAHYNLGVALAVQGRPAEARDEFVAALRVSARSAAAHLNLGRVLAQLGDLPGATRELGEGVRLQPTDVEARCDYGSALAQQGRMPEAVIQFREAARLDPANARAARLLAVTRSRYELGNRPPPEYLPPKSTKESQ
jgi:Flp pilus assembly protein TadD